MVLTAIFSYNCLIAKFVLASEITDSYKGCVIDASPRDFVYSAYVNDKITIEGCVELCHVLGFDYAGAQVAKMLRWSCRDFPKCPDSDDPVYVNN